MARPRFFEQTFAAFRYRDFRILMIGNGLSNVGSWMQNVAQPWLVLTLSGSSFWVGVDGFAGHLPSFLLLLVGGVIADRHSRRQIMVISQIVQLSTAAIIAMLLITGGLKVWMIVVLSLLSGTAQAFSFPAYQALVTTLTPKEHLGNAISLNSLQFNLTRVIGPILAGVAMASVGAVWCFGLNALSFIPLLFALYQIRSPEIGRPSARAGAASGSGPVAGASPPSGILASFGFILKRRSALGMLALVAISAAFCGPVSGFLPVLVKNEFHGDAATFSRAVSIFGMGALSGALWAASRKSALSARFALGSTITISALVVACAEARAIPLLYALLFVAGGLMVASSAAANTFLQSSISSEYRGRTASFFLLSIRGGLAAGNLLTGLLSDRFGIRPALAANGALALMLSVLVATKLLKKEPALS